MELGKLLLFFSVSGMLLDINAINTIAQQPIIWRATNVPIAAGYNEYHVMIKLDSPCEILTNATIRADMISHSRQRCNEVFQKYFIKELELMCPGKSFMDLSHSRTKRELFTLLAIFIISAVASVGFGVTFSQTYTLRTEMNSLNKQLRETEKFVEEQAKQLNLAKEAINLLNNNSQMLGSQLIKIDEDHMETKRVLLSSSFAISYITTRLLLGQHILRETSRGWFKGKLHEPFFDFLNFTLPCKKSCPLQLGSARKCSLSADKDILYMNIIMPIINDTLKLVEADPFNIIHQDTNQTCHISYTGPKNALISTLNDCVHSVNVKHHDLIMSPSGDCLSQVEILDSAKYFKLDHCNIKHPNDAIDNIQIKVYHTQIYIYCFGNNITIGKLVRPCPQGAFILPESIDFQINNRIFKSGQFRLDHHLTDDPLFTFKTNWFIPTHLRMEEILATIPPLKPSPEIILHDSMEVFYNLPWILIIFLVAIGIASVMLLCCLCYRYRQRRDTIKRIHCRETIPLSVYEEW